MSMPDYPLGETLDFKFTTRSFLTGVPTTLGGTPVVQVYEDNSATQITAGITLSADFDSVTGLNNLRIVATSGNGYESGKSYAAVISTGTVGGVSVVGEVVAQFSIERSPALRPTTAGRTLDVTATGAAGIDWANVEGQGTSVDLSATAINLCDTTTTNTDMRGTDNAALASVLGALNDLAAAGDPTSADTVMQYVKQLVNVLVGTDGIATFPAEAAPANNVSLAEVIRAIHADVTGLNGDAMRGTDSAALASVCTEARLSELDAATAGKLANDVGTNGANLSAIPWNSAWDTEVESEVNDALDTTISELSQAAPTATPTLRTGLMLLYMMARNRLDIDTSGGTDYKEVYNDAGTMIARKALTDDGSTYSEAEMVIGV